MDEPPERPSVDRLWALSTDALVEVFDEAIAAVNHHTTIALRALRERGPRRTRTGRRYLNGGMGA